MENSSWIYLIIMEKHFLLSVPYLYFPLLLEMRRKIKEQALNKNLRKYDFLEAWIVKVKQNIFFIFQAI